MSKDSLCSAAARGDVKAVEAFIVDKVDLNSEETLDSFGNVLYTPLQYACLAGHIDVIKLLISANAEIILEDSEGDHFFTELANAVQLEGKDELKLKVLGAFLDIELYKELYNNFYKKPYEDGYKKFCGEVLIPIFDEILTAVNEVFWINDSVDLEQIKEDLNDFIDSLIEDGVNLDVFCGKKTLLYSVIKSAGDFEQQDGLVDRIIIDAKVDLNRTSADGYNPLHHCLKYRHLLPIAETLINNGADVNAARGKNGITPLHLVVNAEFKNIEALYLILDSGQDINFEAKAQFELDTGEALDLTALELAEHLLKVENEPEVEETLTAMIDLIKQRIAEKGKVEKRVIADAEVGVAREEPADIFADFLAVEDFNSDGKKLANSLPNFHDSRGGKQPALLDRSSLDKLGKFDNNDLFGDDFCKGINGLENMTDPQSYEAIFAGFGGSSYTLLEEDKKGNSFGHDLFDGLRQLVHVPSTHAATSQAFGLLNLKKRLRDSAEDHSELSR